MKRLSIYIIAMVVGLLSSCTNDFESINSNPNTSNTIDPGYQFVGIQLSYAGGGAEEWRGNLIMSGPLSGVMQDAYTSGEGYSTSNSFASAKWGSMYTGAIKNVRDMLNKMEAANTDGSYDAKIAEGRIFQVICFQRLTDMYGDIPYFEGGHGYDDRVFYPVYDKQEDIYKDFVKELKESRNILMETESVTFDATGDIIYGHLGSVERSHAWAKLANSMLLRIGMRASSADEPWARGVVEEAVSNTVGFIETLDVKNDAAMITHSSVGGPWGSHENGSGSAINGKTGGFAYSYLGDEYLHRAQQMEDPRLFYVGAQLMQNKSGDYVAWTGQTYFNPFEEAARPGEAWKPVSFVTARGANQSEGFRGQYIVKDGEKQSTVFASYFISESDFDIDPSTGKAKLDADSIQYQILCGMNPGSIGSRTAPTIIFGGDETYFILAEAKAKWGIGEGDALTLLKKADRLALEKYPITLDPVNDGTPGKYMSLYAQSTGDTRSYGQLTEDYLAKITEASVQTIQIERWKSLVINGYEAFALWNRTNLNYTTNGDAATTNIPYNEVGETRGTIDLPVYDKEDITVAGLEAISTPTSYDPSVFPTTEFKSVESHDGGDTEGNRPRRLDYPNSERTVNSTNVEAAIQRQQSVYGYKAGQFITAKMWISKKD
ncbi:SusD/RagB family nutrient-binding outer membrane lipoprotein [Halosquirtibacter laminarini]|uniref:SusD/RagB family nutrient-binding outer membrane lipoprotein n=1 Tax=Halosquirtibacter laminarini TaxID=3374600 RepID=A0AC61NGG1_9BACT|nr:SusD/RagB family nutrient-binding outer membrane lipoprotein [Prolixibacteraceae bacterium]